ncbi:MAG TPA: InlB B-repeat-containing protein [Kofleriaceae bacterium]|nr:InlB B-repeat-containing protein [Kofleriaceae bacterium]
MCGPNGECPPGLDCYGGVCRADNPGIDASNTFPLTISLGGNSMGTVTSNPAGINCGTDCTESFTSGTMVTLTATPTTGSLFVGWSGACSGTGACTITISTAVTVTANFALDNSLVVTLGGNGSGLVTSNPAGINCGTNCSYQFPNNTMVTLTAFAGTGSTFDGWTGAGCSGTGTCTVTTDMATMVTATFSLTQLSLTVVNAGNGQGTVTSNPTGISCGVDCTDAYNYNTMVTLTAAPSTGSTFTGWSGGGCTGTGTCTVTVTAATTVTATFTLIQHSLTVQKSGTGGGTVTSTPAGINCGTTCTQMFDYGTMVTLSAAPATGSTFAGWSGGGCAGTSSCTVTMTMANTVTAIFTLSNYNLTVSKAGNGSGTVTSTPAGISCGTDCTESLTFGTMVMLTAAPATGSTFTGWSGACTGASTTCMVTIGAATDVTATFALNQYLVTVMKSGTGNGTISGVGFMCGADCTENVDYGTIVTLNANPSAGSTFDGWTGGGCSGTGSCQTTITAALTVTAQFTLSQYSLSVMKAGTGAGTVTSTMPSGGITCGADCTELYDYGTMVTLSAAPQAGSSLTSWSGGGCTGSAMTCTVPVTAATTVTATFTLSTPTLTVATNGGSGTGNVTASPPGINCGNGGSDCTEPYPYGTMVTLSAVPSGTSFFVGWSAASCPGNGSCTVTMDAAKTVTATFDLGSQSLSVTKLGNGSGTVTSNPAGISCGATCSFNFTNMTMVTLTATAATGSTFTGWSGGGCSGTSTCTVTIGAAVNISATFQLNVHMLTVMKAGNGATGSTVTQTSPPPPQQQINCGGTCNANFDYGTAVTLSATPAANAVFTGWSGGGCSGTGTCVTTLTANTTVTANFSLVQRSLSVRPIGNGLGTISSSPAGINCGADCDELYNDGQVVMLTATPDPGYEFTGWAGDGAACGTMTTCSVTMNADKGVYADFEPQQYLLSVTKNNNNAGDVFSTTDGGIDCGTKSCSALYDYKTFVSLKASERSGFTFTGWSGDCTGNGSCDVTMDQAKNVTANFVVTTWNLAVTKQGNGAANGTVTSTPGGISCGATCSSTYNDGTQVTLNATATTGTNFTSWSGAPGCSSNPSCVVTMNQAYNIIANFQLQTFSLNLNKGSSTGTGTVTSSPGIINCGPTCTSASQSFNYNTMVTLTATAAYGSTWGGWSGSVPANCTPAPPAQPPTTCTVTMTAAQTVTATFNAVPANRVFVTNATYALNTIGGTSGADTICQNIANGFTPPLGGAGSTWVALLSSSSSDAATRIGSASGWVRTDGRPFANTKADLLNGRWFTPARFNQAGADLGDVEYVTGTTTNGVYSGQGDCTNYSTTTGNVTKGEAQATSVSGYNFGTVGCSAMTMHLLCVQTNRQAVVTVAAPTGTYRRAFMRLWASGGGIADADAKCQMDANNHVGGALPGTYKALLATTSATAISRFNTSTSLGTWYRLDNIALVPTPTALGTATYFDTPPAMFIDGSYQSNWANWAGAPNFTTVSAAGGGDNCTNYTETSAASMHARTGNANMSRVSGASPSFLGPNNPSYKDCGFTSISILCLQE